MPVRPSMCDRMQQLHAPWDRAFVSKTPTNAASHRVLHIRGQPLEVPGAHLKAPQHRQSGFLGPAVAGTLNQLTPHVEPMGPARPDALGMATGDLRKIRDTKLPIGSSARSAHSEEHPRDGGICVDDVPRDEER